MNRPARLVPVPVPVLRLAARLAGRTDIFRQLCGSLVVNSAKARSLLDWQPPISATAALTAAAAAYKQPNRTDRMTTSRPTETASLTRTSSQPMLLAPDPVLASIRLLCCDVDGVMTDGGLYYDGNGPSMVRFHVLDGMGLKRLMSAGVKTCIITQSRNAAIAARARILGVDHCFMGVDDKGTTVAALAAQEGFGMDEVCHIADDVNDISLLQAVGVAVTVPHGVAEVKRICRFVTQTPGGHGAVRELCEAIIASRAGVASYP